MRDREDDPNQYHAKPRDLSLNALEKPHESSLLKSNIFTTTSCSQYDLNEKLKETIAKPKADGGIGIKQSTVVQSMAIPSILSNNCNHIIKSQTGSGKTLAYLVPIINDLMNLKPAISRNDGTRCLVIAPTRELCAQISEVLQILTSCCVRIVGGSITGGEKRKSEKARLRKGVVVLVGTPGRLLDHLKTTESFNLTNLKYLVLDEADRLLDMGKICYYLRIIV